MDIDKKLERLKSINEVDAPPFLYTRIRAQIDAVSEAPVRWRWSFAVAAMMVLALNTSIWFTSIQPTSQEDTSVATVVSAMQLSSTNTFYNE